MNGIINRPKLCFKLQNSLLVIEYTLMNVLKLELKIYCGPDKFYGRSKFGQYDEINDRAPYNLVSTEQLWLKIIKRCTFSVRESWDYHFFHFLGNHCIMAATG